MSCTTVAAEEALTSRLLQSTVQALELFGVYLGKELARASLAVALGKTYRQEGPLSWGYLTPPEDPRSGHVRLTQRPRRAVDGE